MSYQALARKYRPQSYRDIVGQATVVRTLQNAIEQNRIHHAWLFSGVRSVGKTTAARILAKAMLSTGAWNALLKRIEEPTPHVIFMFATTETAADVSTIHGLSDMTFFARVVGLIADGARSTKRYRVIV